MTLLLSVNFLLVQAQTFKAVPLDGGGWTSGFAQADNGRIYAYGDVFGAWRTDNGGVNWSYLNWDIPGGAVTGYGMAVQHDNADVVYYYSYSEIYKSTNGGISWTNILSPLGDNNPRYRGSSPIMIRANNSNEIWFAGPRKNLTGWLWRSQDGGSTWSKMGGSTFDNNNARTLHNVAQYPNQIWVGAADGLYVSADGGSNFTKINGLSDVGMISRFTSGANAGVGLVTRSNGNGGGISRITASDFNNPSTYTVTESGTVNLYFQYPTGLQIFSDNTACAWNTGGDRQGYSTDGGITFVVRNTTLNTTNVPVWTTAAIMSAKNHPDYGTDQVIQVGNDPNKWIITGGGAAMQSLDKGLSWSYFPNGSGIAAVKTYLAGVSRFDANRIYIPASDIGSAIVTDGGASGVATRSSCKFYTDLHSCFRIMEGPDANNLVIAGVKQGSNSNILMKSSDGGVNWAESSLGNLPASYDGIVKSVMSLTSYNDFLVVLAEENGSPAQRVYRTTNGGTSFSGVIGLPDNMPTGGRYGPQNSFIERDATQANVRYFVARGKDFFKSTDGGSNWSAITHPFGTGVWVWGLVADPIRSNNLWAAGDFGGVKVSRDGGQTWTSTAQFFDARYVSSCDGKIAIWGKAGGGSNPVLLWYSSDDGATWSAQTTTEKNFHGVQGITVDRNGKIWVSWNSCTVVTPIGTPNTPVTSVSVNPTSVSVATGSTTNLTATVAPSNASNKSVNWSTSNSGVATVNSSGTVTGVAAGTATITVKTNDGNKTATCAVTVTSSNVAVTGVTMNPTTVSIVAGSTSTLAATVAPSNATNKNVSWASSNTTVATVSLTGVVTGVAAGSATITVTTTDGSKTATSSVTVTSASTGGSGNVTAEYWTNINGTAISNIPLTTTANETSTLTSLEIPSDARDNYGVRITGYIIPSATGSYNLYIASDDNGQLWLSTNDQPANKSQIAYVGNWTSSREWSKEANQKSTAINLTAGLKYYFEALMKEGSGGDNLAIGWTGPGISTITVIGSANLDKYTGGTTTVSVTGVTMSPTTASVVVGATKNLTATVSPSNATNKNVTWGSSNTSIATVSNGIVTAVAAGSATITVTTTDGSKTATCAITVTTAQTGSGTVIEEIWTNVAGTTIASIPTGTTANSSATLTSLEIPANSSDNYGVRITGYIIPTTTGVYNLYIASDDNGQLWLSTNDQPANKSQIAYVGEWTNSKEWTKYISQKSAAINLTSGVRYYFEALMKEGAGGDNLAIGWTGPGISTITVIGSANIDNYTGGSSTVPVTGVTMNPTTTSVTVGATTSLNATVAPSNATNKSVNWSSSNTSIATVSNGIVTGVAVGSATITATTVSESKTATCTVTVTAASGGATKYEAENGTKLGDAVNASNQTGYSGTGFVHGLANTGSGVSFSVDVATAKSYTITVRYCQANGPSYQGSLYVNGSKATGLSYGSLANWNTWDDVSVNVTLNAGINTIAFQKDPGDNSGGNGINIDYISLVTLKSAVVTEETNAIATIETTGILIYPNPVNNSLNIQFGAVAENAQVNLFDIQGRAVLIKNISNEDFDVDVSDLSPGIYIVRIINGMQVINSTIIKN